MRFLSARKVVGIIFAFAALGIVAPAYAQTGGVEGKAIQRDGTPCVKCIILIERLDIKASYHTRTNKKGEYVYIGLPIANYKITLQSPTGETLSFVQKHIGLGEPTQVEFDLPKEQAREQQQRKEELEKNPEMAKRVAEAAKEEKQFKGLKQYFDQGVALETQGNYKEAAAAFEQALPLAKGKNIVPVMARLADCYAKAGENDQAIATYQKAIALAPDDAGLHSNLGIAYSKSGKMDEATAELEKGASLDPMHADQAYYNLCVIMFNSQKMDQAAAACQKAISQNPKNANAYYLKGQALLAKATMTPDGKVKAPDGTIEAFQQYLTLDPSGPNADAAKATIATLSATVSTQYSKKKKKK